MGAVIATAALVATAAASCAESEQGGSPSSDGTGAAGGPLTGPITVLAAASLTDVLGEIGRRFEATNPGARVTFNFGASSALVAQARAGVPADVIATAAAGAAALQALVDDKVASEPEVFARNRLALLVAKANPKGIRTLADLGRPDLAVVLCAVEVPCGSLAARSLAKAGVRVEPKSLEPHVKAVVSRVVLGEADAGIVYVTDVGPARARAEGVDIAPEHNQSTAYLAASLTRSANARVADAFVGFLLSRQARRTLAAAGFQAP